MSAFIDELNALTDFHRKHCRLYNDYVQTLFGDVGIARDLTEIPYLPVRAFKQFNLKSIEDHDVYKIMTSSGTSGQPSKIHLDKATAQVQTRKLVETFGAVISKKRLPMLIIDAESTIRDRRRFSARTAAINGFGMFARERIFSLNDDMTLNLERVTTFLERYPSEPVLIFGFTAMIWVHFIQALQQANIKLNVAHAMILHGGGWKKLAHLQVSPEIFHETIAATIGCNRVHNYYGMIEQTGSIYMACEAGHLHAANDADVLIRDTKNFNPLGHNERGVIQLFSTIQKSYPGHALLTEDVGWTQPGHHCPCGNPKTILHIEGRLEQAEVRGCSDAYAT